MGVLDSQFEDTEINVQEMEREKKQREEEAKKNRGKAKYISQLILNDNYPTAAIAFLSEGFKVKVHRVRDFKNGKEVWPTVFCRGSKCEICAAGAKPSVNAIYGIVDFSNTYTNGAGDLVERPAFKILLRGPETIKVIERRKAKMKDKSLLNKMWQVEKSGSGMTTYYDFTLETESIEIDFDEQDSLETKEGTIDVPMIQMPAGWPEYKTDPKEINAYTKLKGKPDHEIDWHNPEDVDLYLKAYLLQTPLVDYQRYANAPKGKSNGKKNPGVSDNSRNNGDDEEDDF